MKESEFKDLVSQTLKRIADLVAETDVHSTYYSDPQGMIYLIAQEIVGHAAYLMRLSVAQTREKIIAKEKAEAEAKSRAERTVAGTD